MQRKHKILLALSIGALFIFSSKSSNAQTPEMEANNALLIQQQIQQQTTTNMIMQMNMMNMMMETNTEQKHNFEVTLLDGSKKSVTSFIYTDKATKKNFIVFIDKKYKRSDTNRYKRIYPSQTLNLTCIILPKNKDYEHQGIFLPGEPIDSCWRFKAINGPITAYSSLVVDQVSPVVQSAIIGIQLNDGPILKFNQENLKTMVGQDVKALRIIENRNYVRAIKKYNRDNENDIKN